MKKFFICFFTVFCFLFSKIALAEISVSADLLALSQVFVQNNEIQSELVVALKLDVPNKWHVSWKNPGDAGESVDLRLEENSDFEIVSSNWPTPQRIVTGPFVSYGMDKEVGIVYHLRPKHDLKEGMYSIDGTVSLMTCGEECIPMQLPVSAFIRVSNTVPEKIRENEEVKSIINKLPKEEFDDVFYKEMENTFEVYLPSFKGIKEVYMYVENFDAIDYAAKQTFKVKNKVNLSIQKIKDDFVSPEDLRGTVVYKFNNGDEKAYNIIAKKGELKEEITKENSVKNDNNQSLIIAVLLAFIGGILLNLMPCVFPVLFLKVYAILKNKDKPNAKLEFRNSAIYYTLGVVLSFFIMGIIFIVLRSSGQALGWGFQMQNPVFVLSMAIFMAIIGLVFLDVIKIGNSVSSIAGEMTSKLGDFGTGVLAVFVASPCSAPFMGVALGYALSHSAFSTLSVMCVMGVGLALPVLLFGFVPKMAVLLPKPGNWMIRFRQALALVMFLCSMWLGWVYNSLQNKNINEYNIKENSEINVTSNVSKPTLYKFSAKWCLTCLLNEKTTFKSDKVRKYLTKNNIDLISIDWTNKNEKIGKIIESYGREGVPLYVFYKSNGAEPVVFDGVLTPDLLIKKITY
ncbi:MAG: thioredoxin family protein [Alphaproteobacteria bacterium]|nr:thioredoxin family protein [Alphaproteobacteria bacterium]